MKRLPLVAAALTLLAAVPVPAAETQTAVFAGGCFWCTESDFEKLPGVVSAVSGYINGRTEKPTYEQVSAGTTGHTEAVEITFDPDRITYQALLDHFWINHDPTVKNRQFCDSGSQYRAGIYWRTPQQRKLAESSKRKVESSGRFPDPLQTEVAKAETFYPAEAYHQDYYKKNPIRYRFYRTGCGRDARLEQLWGTQD